MDCELSLLENIGRGSFGESWMLPYHRAKHLFTRSFFKRNVAAFRPQHYKSRALERPHKPLARDAGQFGHGLLSNLDEGPERLL
jgi:hypothetical protein